MQTKNSLEFEQKNKTLRIKFISCTSNDGFYNISLAIEGRYLKSDNALVILSQLPQIDKFDFLPSVEQKINLSKQKTITFKIAIDDFDPNKYDGIDFIAKIVCDDLTAQTIVFQIGGKKAEKEDIKSLEPSSKVYLFLKEQEKLGYNFKKDENGKIIKILPYDDGGKDGSGNATIGYGHLIDDKPFDAENEKHKKWKDGITESQADELLFQDVNLKIKLLENGLGDGETKGIKVKLLQREYDALLLAIYNGGYGLTLEKMINRGVEELTKEEIFKTFLFRRNKGSDIERGLIDRRASEASIFVYDDWMPYPSEKFKDYNEFILAYQKFLKNGVLPIILFLITGFLSCNKKTEQKTEKIIIEPYFREQYQQNELLNDKNDKLLSKMDTVLFFSTNKLFYEVKIKKSNVDIKVIRWNEAPDNKIAYQVHGFHKNGYVYTKDMLDSTKYSIEYKILLNKGLFYWNGQNWILVNSGSY